MIWTICFAAITVGATLTYEWYRQQGFDIQIKFDEVDGLIPNQSKIMYRGVQVGSVNEIRFDLETEKPIVHARLTKDISKMLGEDSKFWIVRAELGLGNVNNLSTIATGDYIALDPIKGKPSKNFIALHDQPPDELLAAGLRLRLNASTVSGLEVGSSILYRGLKIGEIGDMSLSKDKKYIRITIFVDKKYGGVIRRSSYFSNISGFHANLRVFGTSHIGMDSLRTVINGGIQVTTPNMGAAPARYDDTFCLLTPEQIEEMEDN